MPTPPRSPRVRAALDDLHALAASGAVDRLHALAELMPAPGEAAIGSADTDLAPHVARAARLASLVAAFGPDDWAEASADPAFARFAAGLGRS